MLTQNQCRKLGLPYIDLETEVEKIEFYQQDLISQLDNLKQSTPKFTLPPTNLNFSDGSVGEIAVDDEYVYIYNQNNVWRRIKLNE